MRRIALVFCWLGCAADPWMRTERVAGETEVVVLGNLHRRHLVEDDFPMEELRAQLVRARPEVILAEIPPAIFEEVRALVAEDTTTAVAAEPEAESETESESARAWLRAFPELAHVVFPVGEELGARVIPVSGFTAAYARDLRAYRAQHPHGPADRHHACAAEHVDRRDEDEGLDPEWLASPSYARLHAWRERCEQTHVGDAMGEAAPRRRDARHVALVVDAVRASPGRRVVVVFDARRRWVLERALRDLPDVTLLDPRAFLDD
ncbi:MAG: hypothetical protein MUE69_20235 [Myxococcota bacterium]|nr:hypothetical protein [Myxococcota bacterium]